MQIGLCLFRLGEHLKYLMTEFPILVPPILLGFIVGNLFRQELGECLKHPLPGLFYALAGSQGQVLGKDHQRATPKPQKPEPVSLE
jgi:hypothetical protein